MKTTPPLSILSAAIVGFLFLVSNISAQTAERSKVVKKGSVVSFEYILSDEEGKVIESNKGKKPLKYTHGQGQIIPGLEKELLGMKVGGEKNIRVKPEDAYGPVNPKAFKEISREKLPPDALKVGTTLRVRNAQGQTFPVRVHEIKEKTVVMDFNHPLAGKTLLFDIKILGIESAEAK
ncbi:MAG: peptidylprolyl isomerase [Candidatus Binatia bacterium]